MDKSINLQQLMFDQLTIPKKLLTSYKDFDLNEQEVVVILQIHRFLSERKEFPTLTEITSSLTLNEQDCALVLRKLIQKQLLVIESKVNEQEQLSEAYSLEPLWSQLLVTTKQPVEEETNVGTIFLLFEQEFGRPLSPFEIEMINSWLDEDKVSPALIKAALRESVLLSKLNFKYIDRILQEWQRKGIHTVKQAREEAENFRKHQTREQASENSDRRDRTFYYNWLEDGE